MLDENTTVDTAASADTSTEAPNPLSDKAQAENPNSDNQVRTFTQDELNRIVAREAKKAADKAIAEKQAEDERLAAEDQGKFKELYEGSKNELAIVSTERDKLRELANQQVEKTIADWPEEFKALVPDANTSPLERLQAVDRMAPAVALVQKTKRAAPDLNSQNGGRGSALDTPEAKRTIPNLVRGF